MLKDCFLATSFLPNLPHMGSKVTFLPICQEHQLLPGGREAAMPSSTAQTTHCVPGGCLGLSHVLGHTKPDGSFSTQALDTPGVRPSVVQSPLPSIFTPFAPLDSNLLHTRAKAEPQRPRCALWDAAQPLTCSMATMHGHGFSLGRQQGEHGRVHTSPAPRFALDPPFCSAPKSQCKHLQRAREEEMPPRGSGKS